MKVGILTHYNVSSHGALLQLHGMKSVLESMGHEVYVLSYNRNMDFIDEATRKRYSASIKNLPYYLKHYIGDDGLGCLFYQYKKQKTLNKFRMSNFRMIPYTKSNELDCVVVGADEVFALDNGVNIMMFGHGVNSKRIIAFAPSFGQTNLEQILAKGCKDLIVSGFGRFNHVSARDEGTKLLIQELTGITPQIVCDPALLNAYKHPKKHSKRRYIVVYSYQSNFKDESRILQIKQYAKLHNCELWSVGVYYKWCDRKANCDPLEMLNVFANAESVITDTFHGTISSYIAHTPMAIYVRDNNNMKLDYLIEQLGLEDRKVCCERDLNTILNQPMDFEILDRRVDCLRTDGMQFLRRALQ